jgi:tRNA dimethylallyltransferase
VAALVSHLDPALIVVAGPTASGKTALALALAERFSSEIVSCDSVAVYRGMEIGTAKPTLAERARVPHHLIDVFQPDQPCTAGDYSRLAREAIVGITERRPPPHRRRRHRPLPARAARRPLPRSTPP